MKINTEGNRLKVEFSWWEKIVSFHRNFSIPFQNVAGVVLGKPKQGWKEIRKLGTFIPGLIKAGIFRNDRGNEFWLWVFGRKPISILLRGEQFDRMVLGVDDDQYWQMMITSKAGRKI